MATSKKVFGKPIGQKKPPSEARSSLANGKIGKNAKHAKQSKDCTVPVKAPKLEHGHSTSQAANEMDEEDIRDLLEMIEDEDDELLQRSKRRKKDASDGTAVDDSTGYFEVEHAQQRVTAEKSRKMRTVDLLPIKTKAGELITRQTEVEIKAKPIENDDNDGAEDGEEDDGDDIIDSDDDVVNDEVNLTDVTAVVPSDKAISTTDLLILREQEVSRQKYRIGIICSGILEKPEDKMKNFNALFELMDEYNNDTPNLFSIRKIATMSLLEVFKDILPEYRIGQIDLKTQKGM